MDDMTGVAVEDVVGVFVEAMSKVTVKDTVEVKVSVSTGVIEKIAVNDGLSVMLPNNSGVFVAVAKTAVVKVAVAVIVSGNGPAGSVLPQPEPNMTIAAVRIRTTVFFK
ncbi:MAG: hypothetical protein JXA66_05405 [Oligoflexia bacterium]|nr:hypothetical protein [Oligoflexia bacterium]